MNELSDTKIRHAKPADKEYTIGDGQGLSVTVRPNGTKLWLYRCRFGGKRKNMSFGTFPRCRTQDRARQAPRRRKVAR
jgi:Arm DNA-binding domain